MTSPAGSNGAAHPGSESGTCFRTNGHKGTRARAGSLTVSLVLGLCPDLGRLPKLLPAEHRRRRRLGRLDFRYGLVGCPNGRILIEHGSKIGHQPVGRLVAALTGDIVGPAVIADQPAELMTAAIALVFVDWHFR